MATISTSPAESQLVSGKSRVLQLLQPVKEVYPATTNIKYSSVDQDLEALKSWLEANPRGVLEVQNVSFEQAEALQVQIQDKGYKVRFDWRRSDQTAEFRMPTSLHNAPATWLTLCVPKMELTVQASARCGEPVLLVHGDGTTFHPGGTRAMQPDNRIDVNVHFQHGDLADTYCVPQPRLVLETAYSQPVEKAEAKAWEHLWAGDKHTHAVIVVDMSYPVTLEKNFVAKIAVWSRQETNNDEEDYPFEASHGYQHERKPRPVEGGTPEDKVESAGSQTSRTATPSTEGSTKVDIDPPKLYPGPDPLDLSRQIETPGYMLVLNERDDSPLQTPSPLSSELMLDIFHFLRRCPQHPFDFPEPCEVALPLAPLQRCIVEALTRHRDEYWPRKRKAETTEEDTAISPLPPQEDNAEEASAGLARLRKWKEQKKARR